MEKKFSTAWKASKQKRKQRKYRFNAPLHIKRKFLSSNLSKDLRKKYGRRSFPLRKGDTIKIMVGHFKKKSGKILEINSIRGRVIVENIQRLKKEGTKVNVPLNPSNLQITELNLEDKKRIKSISREKKVKSDIANKENKMAETKKK